MDDLFRIAREVTDEIMGPGSYAATNEGHPDPRVREQVEASREASRECPRCGESTDGKPGYAACTDPQCPAA